MLKQFLPMWDAAAAFAKVIQDNVLQGETVRMSAAVQFAVKSEAARVGGIAKQARSGEANAT